MSKLRLGSIEFINSLPVDLGLLSGSVPAEVSIVTGAPAALNEKIIRKELDLSPVSVFWYALYHKELLLLPDLSISSQSSIQSVLLFSRCDISDLKGRKIAVTTKGRTTPALLEILCRQRYGFSPDFELYKGSPLDVPSWADACLLIGDDALIARKRLQGQYKVIDLAEEWKSWTGLPIVFAVWAVRRDFFAAHPEETLAAHEALLASKKWGLSNFKAVIKASRERSPLSLAELDSYFSLLRYDFDAEMQKGMKAYLQYAVQCGLLEELPSFETIADSRITIASG